MASHSNRDALRWSALIAVVATVAARAADAATATDQASEAIQALAVRMLSYAAVLAAAGTVAMALVELVKALTVARLVFQRRRLRSWLGAQCDRVMPELLYLAIGDREHEDVLCGQPLEKMMGQIQAAARIALDYPERFPRLYEFLTATDIPKGAESYAALKSAKPDAQAMRSADDRQLWRSHAERARSHDAHKSAELAAPDRKELSDAAQARARLASLVARKLDGFQLRTGYWWDRLNQALGLVFGVAIVWYALGGVEAIGPFERIALGVVGGLLAPFAKDFSRSLASFAAK